MSKFKYLIATLMFSQIASAGMPGVYTKQSGGNSVDVMTLNTRGYFTYEITRQVGGGGGIADEAIVPYETVCRVKQIGTLRNQDRTIRVEMVELIDAEGTDFLGDCQKYISYYKELLLEDPVEFSINFANFDAWKPF